MPSKADLGSLNNIIRSILGRYIAKNKFRLAANLTDFLDMLLPDPHSCR